MKPLVSDALWKRLEPLLPPPPPRRFRFPGRKPLDYRKILTGILFVLKTGIAWDDLPADLGCGCGKTCRSYLQAWQQAGVWRQLHAVLLAELNGADAIDWERAADRRLLRQGPGRGRGYRPESDGPEQIRQQAPRDDRRPRRAAGGDGDRRQRPRDHPGLHDARRHAAGGRQAGAEAAEARPLAGGSGLRLGTGAAGFAQAGGPRRCWRPAIRSTAAVWASPAGT